MIATIFSILFTRVLNVVVAFWSISSSRFMIQFFLEEDEELDNLLSMTLGNGHVDYSEHVFP